MRVRSTTLMVVPLAAGCGSRKSNKSPERRAEAGPIDDVAAATAPADVPGEKKTCALDRAGAVVCWGRRDSDALPTGPFVELVMSTSGEDDQPAHLCGLTAGAEVRCGFF